MNNPRVLIRIAAVRRFGSEQILTRTFRLAPGAVVLSAVSLTQEQTCLARPRDYCGVLVKNVRISLCNLACTKVFTLSPSKALREKNIRSGNFKSSGGKTTKTGGRTPLFRLSAAQKVSWSRSRPVVPTNQTIQQTPTTNWTTHHAFSRSLGHEHADPHKSCNTARTRGPREGESWKCQS
jgi:hypothetical protein